MSDDFTGPQPMPRPSIIASTRDDMPSITLERESTTGRFIMVVDDPASNTHQEAVLPQSVVAALAARWADLVGEKPQPVEGHPRVEWGIRWVEDPETVQGPMDEDYARRKASLPYGDRIVRRTVTEYRPTRTPWEPDPHTGP